MVDVGVDTRGKKVALSLARAGYDVTMLSISPDAEPQEYDLGGLVRVVAVAVPFTRRDRERVARAARRQHRPRTVGFGSAEEGVRHVARTYQRIEQAGRPGAGLAGRARVAALRADVLLSRARTRGQQLSDDVVRTGWRVWDRHCAAGGRAAVLATQLPAGPRLRGRLRSVAGPPRARTWCTRTTCGPSRSRRRRGTGPRRPGARCASCTTPGRTGPACRRRSGRRRGCRRPCSRSRTSSSARPTASSRSASRSRTRWCSGSGWIAVRWCC